MSSSGADSQGEDELLALSQQCQKFRQSFQTFMIASLNAENQPVCSYAPYVVGEDGHFYIFVSELAPHTESLLKHPRCSVMFIENESSCRNLFARQRLTFECIVEEEVRDNALGKEIIRQMKEELGETVALLEGLSDFRLLRLRPQNGRYVVGFGKAYLVDPVDGALSHIGTV